MKTEIATSTDSIANVAAYLANNIEFVVRDLEPSGQGIFSQRANMLTIILLPRYQRGRVVNFEVKTDSAIAELALLKMMLLQSQEIAKHIRKQDSQFAGWVFRC